MNPVIDYEEWNQTLAEYFFNSHFANKPVYLQLDEETLYKIGTQLGLEPEQAQDVFVNAVKSRLRKAGANKEQFDNFFRMSYRWRLSEVGTSPYTPPPFIAFLGLCVLAASHMSSDDEISAANYYVHLNQLLGLGQKRGRPAGFERVEECWLDLNWWLDDILQGKYGYATANNDYSGTHIGYPISQCLLRQTDREKLSDFFQWAGLEPDENESTLESKEFLPLLKEWTHKTTCTFSQHGRNIFQKGNDVLMKQVTQLAFAQYQLWDGGSYDVTGKRLGDIKLQLEFSRRWFECSLYARALPDFPEGSYQIDGYGSIALVRSFAEAQWFNPLEETLLKYVVEQRPLRLSHNEYSLQLMPRAIIPFRNDTDSQLGGWVSCAKVGLGEKHFLLCHKEMQPKVEAYLGDYAELNWKKISSRQTIFEDKEWICFYNVRISKMPTVTIDDALSCLVPAQRVGIRLSGGLKIKRGIWLSGGEPEAIISTDDHHLTPIYIDDVQVGTVSENVAVIPLSKFNLTAERHTIRVANRTYSFAICESGSQLIQTPSEAKLTHPINIDHRQNKFSLQSLNLVPLPKKLSSQELYICGASLLSEDDRVIIPVENVLILPYGGRRYVVLGHLVGEAFEKYEVADIPLWMAEQEGYLQGHKVTLSFRPQWIIKMKGSQKVLIPVGIPQHPSHSDYEHGDISLWVQWAKKASLGRRLNQKQRTIWKQYNQLARKQNEL